MAIHNRKKIKVAVFVAGNETYGQQSTILIQHKASNAHDIDFHYICLHEGELYQNLLTLGADVRIIGGRITNTSPSNPIKLFFILLSQLKPGFGIFRKIRTYLKETRPDLLFTHEITEHIIGGLAARSCGIKAVGQSHVIFNPKRNLGLSRIFVGLAHNLSLDMILPVSNASRDSLWGVVKKKAYPIYVGRDIQNIYKTSQTMAARKECPASDIIYIGRLDTLKKQDVLIEALGILAREGLHAKTFFVSGGNDNSNPYYVKLQRQISGLGLEDDITFIGYVSEPYGLLAKAKISVLCCTRDAGPNVVFESMACRTPIIVPDAGGAGELVKEGVTGLKFKPDDPASLAKCLRRLLQDEQLRKQLTEKGFIWANENITVKAHMTQLRKRFEQLVEN
jgi:glycosyltransferase involved in cell wall biosynthesis